MGPGAPEELGAPVLLETLALQSCMTSENAKVVKIGNVHLSKNPQISTKIHKRKICYIILLSSNCKQ